MFLFDYIGIHYTNQPDFVLDQPQGLPHYFFTLFLTDIYIRLKESATPLLFPGGTVLLYSPYALQYYYHPTSGFSNDWFQFSGTNVNHFLDTIQFPINVPFSVRNADTLHQRLQQIEQEFFAQDLHRKEMLDLMAKELFINLAREYRYQETDHKVLMLEQQFRNARHTILSSLEHNWTIEEMAALVDLSPSRFSHIYTTLFHISPKRNLLLERMNKAKFLIQTQNYSVSEAAACVGYDNLYHFSKQFHKTFGKAPSAYRKL